MNTTRKAGLQQLTSGLLRATHDKKGLP